MPASNYLPLVSSNRKQISCIVMIFLVLAILLLFNHSISTPTYQPTFLRPIINGTTSVPTIPMGVHFFTYTTPSPLPTSSTTTPTSPQSTTRSADDILCDNITLSQSTHLTTNPCERTRCVVLVRNIGGRLGNRMFIFASAYGLARTHNCHLYMSDRASMDVFGNFAMKTINRSAWLSEEAVKNLTNIRVENIVCTFKPELLRPRAFQNLELIGYWQSYLYFDAYREDLRRIFTAKSRTLNLVAEFLTGLMKPDCPLCPPLPNTSHEELRDAFRTRYNITWVGIHFRLRDFIRLGYSSDENYIRQSMQYFRRRFYPNRVRFLLGSDDTSSCERMFAEEIKQRMIFILPYQEYPHGDDLMALTLCHHSIATGGTYSFWSAYLTGGEVIHDIRYQAACPRSDYYPPWFLLVGPTTEKKEN